MKIIETIEDMAAEALAILRSGKTHGFVPTMGALHEGHAALIEQAAQECEIVTVSIFVNPIQFNEGEDFEKYPRTFEADVEKATAAGASIIFAPTAQQMYPENRQTVVMVDKLTNHLCGISRGRGHFAGVCTVVAKLFNIVRPDFAYFGQKDAQQALILQRMAIDLNFPLKIRVCPIIREKDGLAMSSRNVRIPPEKREEALALWRALSLGRELIEAGERNSTQIISRMAETILESGDIEIDYIDIVSTETLEDVETIDDLVMLAGAIRLADVRLIDNVLAAPADYRG